jgi:hypothetical protein
MKVKIGVVMSWRASAENKAAGERSSENIGISWRALYRCSALNKRGGNASLRRRIETTMAKKKKKKKKKRHRRVKHISGENKRKA